jgi:hypothetical protein
MNYYYVSKEKVELGVLRYDDNIDKDIKVMAIEDIGCMGNNRYVYLVNILDGIIIDQFNNVSCCKLLKEYDLFNKEDLIELVKEGLFVSVGIDSYIRDYSEYGDLDVLDYLLNEYGIDEYNKLRFHYNLMNRRDLSKEKILHYVENYVLCESDVKSSVGRCIECYANLEYLKVLIDVYDYELSSEELGLIASSYDSLMFGYYSECLKYLPIKNFKIDDTKFFNLFYNSCKFGNISVLKELAMGDSLVRDGIIFGMKYNQIEVVKYLINNYGLRAFDEGIIKLLCSSNNILILEYLIKYGLKLEEHLDGLISGCNEYGSYELLEYINGRIK